MTDLYSSTCHYALRMASVHEIYCNVEQNRLEADTFIRKEADTSHALQADGTEYEDVQQVLIKDRKWFNIKI